MKKILFSFLVFTFTVLVVHGREFSKTTTKNLDRFQGYLNTNKVNLSWAVLDNDLVYQFEVQKSTDGKEFQTVAFVLSSEKSGGENYEFNQSTGNGVVYYRLKMMGDNERITYSMILVFKPAASREFNLKVLNSSTAGKLADKMTVSFQAAKEGPVTLTIFDIIGRQLMQKTLDSFKGTNLVSLPVQLAGNGVYIVDVYDGETHNTTKFIK